MASKKIQVKYFAGWLSAQNIETPGFIIAWKQKAKIEQALNRKLFVVSLPNSINGEEPEYFLEKLLQEKLDKTT